MKRILSGALAAGLMLLTFPVLAASAADTGTDTATVAASAVPAEETVEPTEPAVEPTEEQVKEQVKEPDPVVETPVAETPVAEKAAASPSLTSTFETYKEHARWLVPAEVGNPNGKTVNALFFPQPKLVGAVPCGRWSQDDEYLIKNQSDKELFKSLGEVLEWLNGHPEDSGIYESHVFTYGGDCPPPDKAVVLDYTKVCGAITLTTHNGADVPANWYYGLQGKVDDVRVVSAVQKGPGDKSGTKTFAEDFNGGSVTVQVMVYAATEQDLLPAEWPNLTTVVDVVVDTDCLPNQPPAEPRTKFDESCTLNEVGGRNDYTGTEAYIETEPGVWVLSGKVVWDEPVFTAYSDKDFFEKCAGDQPETLVKVTTDEGFTCDGRYLQDTTVTTPYIWDEKTRGWVADEANVTTVVGEWVFDRKLTADEKTQYNCVVKTPPSDNPNTLAFTGGGDSPLGPIGLAAIAAGLLLVVAVKRLRA